MNLLYLYILQVHQYIWNLLRMVVLQILWQQVQLLRLHSVVLVLEQVIHQAIMDFQFVIQLVIFLTEKVRSYRVDRLLPLRLWMQDLLQLQLLTRDILQRQLILMLTILSQSISLIRVYMRIEYLILRERQIQIRRFNLVQISKTGLR